MTIRVQPRIEAATLLAHEFQERGGQFSIRPIPDLQRQRSGTADFQNKSAGRVHRGKIQFNVMRKSSPGGIRDGSGLALKEHVAFIALRDQREARWQRRFRKSDGQLRLIHVITDLAGADENLVTAYCRESE